jgi:uncharacterized protein (TIGR01319 family)
MSTILPESLRTVLVTDCGSTTTKALLFEKTADGWRQTFRGEAPTTVEEPVADVTVGALNAFNEVQELSKRQILKSESQQGEGSAPFTHTASDLTKGIDLYLSTSSAGGGLQMMVTGLVRDITTESAERAALGAGAIVMDALSADDGREDFQRIEKIRHLRPDIVLMTGGTDGGSKTHAIEMAEILFAAAPRPRFGDTLQLPIIFAGNQLAATEVEEILSRIGQVKVVPNVRPSLAEENLAPAREAIHEFFLTHVMSHSPGYGKLLSWSPVPVMPTPAAVGDIVERHAHNTGQNVLCADIGGATTDVFSVFRDLDNKAIFNRTVSANLGMSYSVANVLIEAGVENIRRWLPFDIEPEDLRDRLRNKMIRPTSIPQTIDDLLVEQAVCREALRLSLKHHAELAVGISAAKKDRGIADIFSQKSSRYHLVDRMKLDMVIGSGGVLSHAPRRIQAALMMLDGFELQGVTNLAVDSIFMMPHLGVLASVHPDAAQEIFLKDCLVHLGVAVAPLWERLKKDQSVVAKVFIDGDQKGEVRAGQVSRLDFKASQKGRIRVEPCSSEIDVGAGKGQALDRDIVGGDCGIILDGRNRPIEFAQTTEERRMFQEKVNTTLGIVGL